MTIAAWLHWHCRDDPVTGALQQVPDEGPADAETEHHELLDAEMVHQAEMIVGIGVPRPVHFQRARGLTAFGIPQIRRDHAELVGKFIEWVERVGRKPGDCRIKPAARDNEYWKADTRFFVMDTSLAFF